MPDTIVDHVHDDPATLADTVARDFLDLLTQVQAQGRDPHVVLTGGSIANAVHARVADLGAQGQVDWGRVHFWWGDERFVLTDHEERNARQAQEAMFARLPVDPAFVHRAPGADEVPDVETAAAQYRQAVQEHGPDQFDLVMLGLGPDGHIASLFPGHEALRVGDDSVAIAVRHSPKPPPERVSLTLETLSRTPRLWVMVTGAEKAEAVARTRTPGPVEEAPLRGLLEGRDVQWHMDRAAASPR